MQLSTSTTTTTTSTNRVRTTPADSLFNLEYHHMGARFLSNRHQYHCSECPKRYASPHQLRSHYDHKHLGQPLPRRKPRSVCPYCSQGCNSTRSLLGHVVLQHRHQEGLSRFMEQAGVWDEFTLEQLRKQLDKATLDGVDGSTLMQSSACCKYDS